ncbi:MAG: hypothetical protein R3B72_15115 [Polyangiaceae bacterium]
MAAGCLLVGLLAPATAAAHGRFPQAGQIVVDPSDDGRVWVRTTYGIVTTDDHGGEWRWICPEGVGFDGDKEDPPLVLTRSGAALVGTFDGLSRAADRCDFTLAGGALEGRYVIDLLAEPSADDHAIALTSNGLANDVFEVHLWGTSDEGATFSEVGTSPPQDFLALTLGLAKSDVDRIYVSGRDGTAGVYAGALMRSDDRGQTWTRYAVPGTDGAAALPYLGGVDPDDPDRLYVATIQEELGETVAFELLVSEDGGATFTTIFQRSEAMSGFALSPDGATIAVGGPQAGLWLASRSDYAFAKVNEVHIRCLTWTAQGLYACTDQFVDGYNVGVSTDEGQTFAALSQLSSPCGPPSTCAKDSSVGKTCPAAWPQERAELMATDCDAAGGGGAGEGGGGAGGEGTSGGCGCRLAAPREGTPAWLSALGLLAALPVLRRRRR